MLGKLKKTLGRRKPLGSISAPNEVVVPSQAPAPPRDDKLAMKSHLTAVLADPEILEQHYKEMLQSRGTSAFARSQMGQIPDTTKRELVRMWLMSAVENPMAENVAPPASPDANRKRAYSSTSPGRSSEEDESKRQKMAAKRHTFIDVVPLGNKNGPGDSPKPGHDGPKFPRASGEADAVDGREIAKETRPKDVASSRSCSENSQAPAVDAADPVAKRWVDAAKHMHHVVTHRDEYDPKTTKELGFEKTVIQIRLFLRAESIRRLRQFIDTGGLSGLVGIVTGILDVEWREQHETRLLLGILHCIRIILKTEEGANRFHAAGQHRLLFPRLVRMQFSWGEERRAFFRFDHRAVVTEIFYYWVRNVGDGTAVGTVEAAEEEAEKSTLEDRANQMLAYLQDFDEEEKKKKQHDFVAAMHKPRRYKNWHKEVKNTTQPWQGTPWMYYHKENVIRSRQEQERQGQQAAATATATTMASTAKSHARTFSDAFAPTRRPELVSSTVRSHTETLVSHYVAANLDLMNICIVARPRRQDRNELRRQLADCGFEDLFGSKLRLASQVNFPCIESALRDWVTAAEADGWPVAHVTALPDETTALAAVPDLASSSSASSSSSSSSSSPSPLAGCLLQFDVLEDTPFDL